MNVQQTIKHLQGGALDARLAALYGQERVGVQRARYESALRAFGNRYGEDRDVSLFSVPGRSELSGNHTDHNCGCVIAAAVDLDIIAVAAKNEDSTVRLLSEGFPEDTVNLDVFSAPVPARFSHSDAIIAGVCAGLRAAGYRVGGFDAYTTSDVPKGSGLSSSAAFENMVGNIENHFYNAGKIDNALLAQISQYAENAFFGKPCGLMDQTASAVGGVVAIDFADNGHPRIDRLSLDLDAFGYSLCILNTGGNHADLTPDYAAVPAEMKALAAAMGKRVLRELDEDSVLNAIPTLRARVGDRAILRALHFFAENRRVAAQRAALSAGDLPAFLELVKQSGLSSFCYLQNVYSPANPAEQGVSLALRLAEQFLSDKKGAWRVHGGGFAGTVQAYVQKKDTAAFCTQMNAVFGKDACTPLRIRAEGAIML